MTWKLFFVYSSMERDCKEFGNPKFYEKDTVRVTWQ